MTAFNISREIKTNKLKGFYLKPLSTNVITDLLFAKYVPTGK